MKKKTSIVYIVITVIITVSLVLLCRYTDSILLNTNWGTYLPPPKEKDTIFSFDYREGDDFEIWEYSKSKIENIKEKKGFTSITSNNIEDVRDIVNEYYEDLEYDKDLQYKFNENFSTDNIVVEGNYYSLTKGNEKPGCYLLMVLDVNTNKIYYLNHIR